jgi:hypothetical protein
MCWRSSLSNSSITEVNLLKIKTFPRKIMKFVALFYVLFFLTFAGCLVGPRFPTENIIIAQE